MNLSSSSIPQKISPQIKQWGWVLALSILAGGAGWGVMTMRASKTMPAAVANTPVTVTTAVAVLQPVHGTRTLTGTVEPIESVTLTSRVMGQIRHLLVEEGDHVNSGQLIANIDVRDINAQRRQAEAAVPQAQAAVTAAQMAALGAQSQNHQAQASLDAAQARQVEVQAQLANAKLHQRRMAMLRAEGAISQSQLDEANTNVAVIKAQVEQTQAQIQRAKATIEQTEKQTQQAQAQVKQAQAQVYQADASVSQTLANLDYGTVKAPFSGVITRKLVEVGAMAGPGQQLVTLESTDRLRLSVEVPESLIAQVRSGQTVSVRLDALDRTISGRVSQIVPSVNPTSRNFTVKVSLPKNPSVLPGMFARLQLRGGDRVSGGDRKAVIIPQASLVKQFGVTGVFKVANNRAQFQPITTGQTHNNKVEVFSGLKAGDRVIVQPQSDLKDGTALNIS